MQWKLHVTVITAMTAVLSLGYFALKPEPVVITKDMSVGETHIRVIEATWGMNCNPYIEAKRRDMRALETGEKNPDGETPPELIQPNNALNALQAACENKLECKLEANNNALGNPYADCSKMLNVAWRCFAYDKLHQESLNEGDTLRIDCNPSAEKPATN